MLQNCVDAGRPCLLPQARPQTSNLQVQENSCVVCRRVRRLNQLEPIECEVQQLRIGVVLTVLDLDVLRKDVAVGLGIGAEADAAALDPTTAKQWLATAGLEGKSSVRVRYLCGAMIWCR